MCLTCNQEVTAPVIPTALPDSPSPDVPKPDATDPLKEIAASLKMLERHARTVSLQLAWILAIIAITFIVSILQAMSQ